MIVLEAVNAKFGDALLLRYRQGNRKRLWVIDGGPRGVWSRFLKPRLEQLRGSAAKLTIDLAMLSHVDDDHVNGILQMTKGLALASPGTPRQLEIRRFWHNSFADMVGAGGNPAAAEAALAGFPQAAAASLAASAPLAAGQAKLMHHREQAVLASIGQGRELRDYLTTLALGGNSPIGSLIASPAPTLDIDGAKVTVIGPIRSRLDALQVKWQAESGNPAALASLFRDDLDESVTNLSSIVLLVEVGGRSMLLTGDARGDDILEGFKAAGLENKLPMRLDILKMPHHGSDRNMTEKFLESFPAGHYIISADGKHGNPDGNTLRAIVASRGDDEEYQIVLTNKVAGLPGLLAELSQGRRFRYVFRRSSDLSIPIELA